MSPASLAPTAKAGEGNKSGSSVENGSGIHVFFFAVACPEYSIV